MSHQRAADLFGGVEIIRGRLLAAVWDRMGEMGVRCADLSGAIGLQDPSDLARILSGETPLDGETSLALLALLGIRIDQVLPLPSLPEEVRRYWEADLESLSSAPVAGCGAEARVDKGLVLGLFLHLTALKELDIQDKIADK